MFHMVVPSMLIRYDIRHPHTRLNFPLLHNRSIYSEIVFLKDIEHAVSHLLGVFRSMEVVRKLKAFLR